MKYHNLAYKNIESKTHYIPTIIPKKLKFRHNEILEINPEKNLLLGNNSLRQSYDKLIMSCGLQPDFLHIPGMIYSLEEMQNPIFANYEYEKILPKMGAYTYLLLMNKNANMFKEFTRDYIQFCDKGNGHIVFCSAENNNYENLENIQMICLLYDLILKFRKKSFLETIKLSICFPFSEKEFLVDSEFSKINSFFVNLLQERNINILWEHKLKSVNFDNNLSFENKKDIKYDYSYISPKMTHPSIIKYTNSFDNLESFNPKTLKLEKFENVYVLGDLFNTFYDRFYPNIFLQANIISNNLKVENFRLPIEKLKEYTPSKNIFFNFLLNHYIFSYDSEIKLEKKGFYNKFLMSHLFNYQDGFYAENMFMKRKLNIKLY